jgi:hypothetical protein|nr:MAG TPA: hypothetical protein [Bacteriophage sp.]
MKLFNGVYVRVTHKIDRKNKVIMARAEDCEFLPSILEGKLVEGTGVSYVQFKESDHDKLFLNDEYTAKVRCVTGDEFDVEEGLKLVDEKLKKKLTRVILKRMENREKVHSKMLHQLREGMINLLSDSIDKGMK